MTFFLKMYCDKNTQNMSYTKNRVRIMIDIFKLGILTELNAVTPNPRDNRSVSK